MNRKLDIEARLHRSLANQVRTPKLDRRFDDAVWARIEAEENPSIAAAPATDKSSAARWLRIINGIGFLVAALLVAWFGVRIFGSMDFGATLPQLSFAPGDQTVKILCWAVAGAAIVFGVLFTPIGRWLRSELS